MPLKHPPSTDTAANVTTASRQLAEICAVTKAMAIPNPNPRKCKMCNSKKKAKYFGLHFHDLRRTGVRNMSRKGIPENVGMLISGHKTDSVYRRYNIIDMEVLKEATAKIEEHQRGIKPENSHRSYRNWFR
jgi:hypothetical protein